VYVASNTTRSPDHPRAVDEIGALYRVRGSGVNGEAGVVERMFDGIEIVRGLVAGSFGLAFIDVALDEKSRLLVLGSLDGDEAVHALAGQPGPTPIVEAFLTWDGEAAGVVRFVAFDGGRVHLERASGITVPRLSGDEARLVDEL